MSAEEDLMFDAGKNAHTQLRIWISEHNESVLPCFLVLIYTGCRKGELINAGNPLRLVPAMVGHTDPETTMRYSHIRTEDLKGKIRELGVLTGAFN